MEIEVWRGDITKLDVPAIVNAANSSLLGGGGVDGAIHRAAGPGLFMECVKLRGCKVGQAKVTRGHKLPAEWIIHTVGPYWRGGEHGEKELLTSCYAKSLALADELKAEAVAFPAISTGIYRFPPELAAQIAVAAIREFEALSLKRAVLVAFDESMEQTLKKAIG